MMANCNGGPAFCSVQRSLILRQFAAFPFLTAQPENRTSESSLYGVIGRPIFFLVLFPGFIRGKEFFSGAAGLSGNKR
jgi:hypothetical protein